MCCQRRADYRPSLQYVAVEHGMAVATDAHVMVFIKLADFVPQEIADALGGRLIPAEAWKALHELTSKPANRLRELELQFEGNFLVIREHTRFIGFKCPLQSEMDKYPDWIALWNRSVELDTLVLDSIGWNQSYMNKAVKASGITRELTFEFKGPSNPILFGGLTPDKATVYGLVMPVMLSTINSHKATTISIKHVKTQ